MKHNIGTYFAGLYLLAIILLPAFFILYPAIEDMQLNPFDYARITDVDYKAVVVDEPNSQGKVIITERITFDIHAASRSNTFWELWRDLPEDYIDGVKVDYKVNSVKQILPDGIEITYEESPKLYWDDSDYTSYRYGPGKWYHSEGPYNESAAQYECVFFYIDGVYREEMVFEIEYEMNNAALRYNDCSDLYLALYSGTTCNHLESFRAQILFPDKDMPSPGNYDVTTYGTNAHSFPVTESSTINPGYHTFSIELDEEDLKFKPYNEYIEFDLVSYGKDRHIFTEYAPSNYYSEDDVLDEIREEQRAYADIPATYKNNKLTALLICSIIAVILLIYAFTMESRIRSKFFFFRPNHSYAYYRDIPDDLDPNFAATLVHCKDKRKKDDSGVYSAILLSLARKKYITLTEWGTNDILITILYSTIKEETLTPSEELYYNLLVRHANGSPILMSYLQTRISSDYSNTDSFLRGMTNSITNIGINYEYFQKISYDQPRKHMNSVSNFLMTIGIVALTVVNFISGLTRMEYAFGGYTLLGLCCIVASIFLKVRSRKLVLLTQFGEDEYQKWRGLYNFLNSETLISERTVIELPLWEKYLVYATAFGLSEKVIKAIGIRCPEVSESPVLSNDCYRSRSFRHRTGRSFRSSVRTGSSIARSGGGGFGYGGGGRGGGGGGGGH